MYASTQDDKHVFLQRLTVGDNVIIRIFTTDAESIEKTQLLQNDTQTFLQIVRDNLAQESGVNIDDA